VRNLCVRGIVGAFLPVEAALGQASKVMFSKPVLRNAELRSASNQAQSG
jgi:hypothetical protein